jgi:heptosyltransferase-1
LNINNVLVKASLESRATKRLATELMPVVPPLNILIVKLSSLGDVVHTLSAVMDIRAEFEDAKIDWVVERSFAPLLKICPAVNSVIESDIRAWRKSWWKQKTRKEFTDFKKKLQENSYDAIIDLQGLTKSALVSKLAKLKVGGHRYAMGNQTNGASYEFMTRWVADKAIDIHAQVHAVERARIICSKALGYTYPRAEQLQTEINQDEMTPLVVSPSLMVPPQTVALVHASSREDKTWPLQNWTELGEALIKLGFNIALPQGSPKELEMARQISNTLPGSKVWVKMNLNETAAHLRACVGVIGVDSGLSHIAEALDLPLVQIYNFDTYWRTGPQRLPFQRSVYAIPTPSVQDVLSQWKECWDTFSAHKKDAKFKDPSLIKVVETGTLPDHIKEQFKEQFKEQIEDKTVSVVSDSNKTSIESLIQPNLIAVLSDVEKKKSISSVKKTKISKTKTDPSPQPDLFD